jgi:hypothetical protein
MSDALFLIRAKLPMHPCLLFVMGRYAIPVFGPLQGVNNPFLSGLAGKQSISFRNLHEFG